MDIENLVPLLFAAIYIISRVLKARKKNAPNRPVVPQQNQRPRPVANTQQPAPKKGLSFEDILREFEKNLSGELEEEKPLPVQEIKHEKPTRVQPAPKPEPYKYQNYQDSSYKKAPQPSVAQEEEHFSRNEKYKLKENLVSDYVTMLRDPDGAKHAIVLSEIINKKYF